IGRYEVVKYKKWSLPISVFILTIIAVAVSSIKRRGGMGVNLAIGIGIAMVYVFFDKVFGVMAEQSNFSPLVAVWFPYVIFGTLAIYMLYNAKRYAQKLSLPLFFCLFFRFRSDFRMVDQS